MNTTILSRVLLIVAIVALCAAPGFAQQDRGTFTGTVTDSSGAAIPGVAITIQNANTGAVYNSETNEIGQYTVPNLPIGQYSLTFESDGFKQTVRDGLTLQISQVARIDVTLEIGATTESVTVTGETPLLQTDNPEVGSSLDNQRIVDLPLSFSGGRSPENFAYKLTAGVSGNNWTSRINGSPAFSKEVLLDGASASIYLTGHFGESSVSLEALEEFKIQTSGMSAEFGRTAGGIFNFVMKSGSNDLHGSGLYQFRNEWMNANSFANNAYGRPKARDRRHNWAFSVGGPVFIPKVYNGKNKSFFYVTFEKYKDANRGTGSPSTTVPTAPWYTGDMSNYLTSNVLGEDALGRPVLQGQIYDPASVRTLADGTVLRDPFVGNIIPQSRMSRVSKNVMDIMGQHYMPQVDSLVNNRFFPSFNTAKFEQKQLSIKGDHYLSTDHKLSGSFAWVDRPRTLLDQGGVWDFNDADEGGPLSRARLQKVETFMARASWDWTVAPTMLNHFGVAFNRQLNPSISHHIDEPGGEILGIAGIPQDSNYPHINWGGGDRVDLADIGYEANDQGAGTTWQLLDTFSLMKGKHTIKFGGDIKRSTLSWGNLSSFSAGQFNFESDLTGLPGFNKTGHPYASFFLGAVTDADLNVNSPTTMDMYSIGLFVQDDIKVNQRLTLNLGVRWDGQPVPTEWHNRIHHFDPNMTDPLTGLPGAVRFGDDNNRRFAENEWNDFSPRIGLAYRIRDKIAFRAGYGIFYTARTPNEWSGVPYGNRYGFTATNKAVAKGIEPSFNWDDGYPGVVEEAAQDPSNSNGSQWNLTSYDPNGGRVGYTQQWNANLQFELPHEMVLDVGYVGTKATGIIANQLRQMNQIPYSALALGDTLGKWISSDAEIPAEAKAMGAIYPYTGIANPPGGGAIPISQTLQPFPQVISWNVLQSYYSPLGFNTYNSLQIQFNKRYSSGLSWMFNYTFSKSIDNLDSAFNSWVNSGRPADYYNLKLEKTISPYDIPHVVKVGVTYEIPVGQGRKFGADMHPAAQFFIGGWTIQYLGNYSSGTPLGYGASGIPNFNESANRAQFNNPGGQELMVSNFDTSTIDMQTISNPNPSHRILNTSIVSDKGRYEIGNASYRMSGARNFPDYVEDFSLQKNFWIKERVKFQFRWDLLNAFNRHRFNSIQSNVTNPLFGQVTGVSGNFYRSMQLGLRADF